MARADLEHILAAVRNGETPDRETLERLADAFRSILEHGERAERALGLSRSPGRPRQSSVSVRDHLDNARSGPRDRVAAVIAVLDHYDDHGQQSYEALETTVAPDFSISAERLRKWRQKYGEIAQALRETRDLRARLDVAFDELHAAGIHVPADTLLPAVLSATQALRALHHAELTAEQVEKLERILRPGVIRSARGKLQACPS